VRGQPFVLAPGAALRTESAREAPGYAERDGSLPLPNLLAIPACRIKIANDGLPRQACGTAPATIQAHPAASAHALQITGPNWDDGSWPAMLCAVGP
jgi:hypothetical protein